MLAQLPPGFEEAIAAASNRGWEAVTLVILVVGGFSGAAVMFKYYSQQAAAREEKLSERITHLENLIHTRLFAVVDNNAAIMSQMMDHSARLVVACDRICQTMDRFEQVLSDRPCMAMEAAERAKLVDALTKQREGGA